MRCYPSLVLFLVILVSAVGQGQTLDVPPKGHPNERAVEGGSYPVPADSTTPLPELIRRLSGPWELVETGKAYWIGYTNDMFSIAAHKDAALEPLLQLFREAKDPHTKNGVVFCLHLIGINSAVIGRFEESFLNASARNALLGLIEDEQCGDLAIQLLARDPWPTDVPRLVEVLKTSRPPRTAVICSLFRYTNRESPFRQDIGEDWDTILLEFRDHEGQRKLGELRTVVRERNTDDPEILNAMDRSHLVDQWGKEGRILRKIVTSDNGEGLRAVLKTENPARALYHLFLLSKEKVSVFSFCDLDDKLWHTVEPNRLVLVSPEIARQMWVEYFIENGTPSAKK